MLLLGAFFISMTKSLADTIIYDDATAVANALDAGANILETDEYGFNPLIEAAICQKNDIATLLIDRGAKIDMPDLTGRTALHWAADNHNMEQCRLLLQQGANPNSYNSSAQPVLVYPLLRGHQELKRLLYKHGASLEFAQDYINSKLLGHRFALPGQTHIYSPEHKFILVDFEGFVFEFTANLMQDSLHRFINNYAAKHLSHYAKKVNRIVHCFQSSASLIKYQQYSTNLEEHMDEINRLLSEDMVLIPAAYTGHAITLIKFQDILIKCDRGAYGREHKTVTIYKMPDPKRFAKAVMRKILYKKNNEEYIHYGLNKILDLREIYSLPLPPQVTGNCSWANVEAAIPSMMFLLLFEASGDFSQRNLDKLKRESMDFFHQWLLWDQDRAIDECIQSFYQAEGENKEARQATKAQVLAAITAYHCDYKNTHDIERAEKMMKVLNTKQFHYMLDAYVEEFAKTPKEPLAQNLKHLLDIVNYRR